MPKVVILCKKYCPLHHLLNGHLGTEWCNKRRYLTFGTWKQIKSVWSELPDKKIKSGDSDFATICHANDNTLMCLHISVLLEGNLLSNYHQFWLPPRTNTPSEQLFNHNHYLAKFTAGSQKVILLSVSVPSRTDSTHPSDQSRLLFNTEFNHQLKFCKNELS